jgi:hypothetical protein
MCDSVATSLGIQNDKQPDGRSYPIANCGGWPATLKPGRTGGLYMVNWVLPPNMHGKASRVVHFNQGWAKDPEVMKSVTGLITPYFVGTDTELELYEPWDVFKTKCCVGDESLGDRISLCGNYKNAMSSSQCNPSMTKYCGSDPKTLSDAKCQEWCVSNPGGCNAVTKAMCNASENINSPHCQSWCKKTGECDYGATSYCNSNPSDPMCTCITSPIKKYNPACIDSACISTGYIPQSMRTLPCPNVVDCSTQLDLKAGGRTTALGTRIEQNCGTNSGDMQSVPSQSVPSQSVPSQSVPSQKSKSKSKILLVIIILLVLMGLLGVGGIMLFRTRT